MLSKHPLIILDGAHNQAGVKALADLIRETKYSSCVAIIGMMREKNIKDTLKEIAPYISEFICVEGFHPNAMPANELADIITSLGSNAFAVYDMELAIKEAKKLISEKDLLVIFGSLYLSSQARKIYMK